jgi:drug/metabolite transporter (DMT)-like permease
MSRALSRSAATLIGFLAVLLWSLLATLTAASGDMPSLQLTAITFGIGGLCLMVVRPGAIKAMRQPLSVWLVGVIGLAGYHFAYFFALKNAPPVEASLINYFWPVLIVVMSAMLPGEKLRWNHIAGCILALGGAGLVVTRGQGLVLDGQYALGYAAALFAAFAWSSYSILSRRMAKVPSEAIAGFCLVVALLAWLSHLALETTVWPSSPWQWAAIVSLGLAPVGLAFYVWDIGVKQGDIQILGAASYLAPLLSTLLLIVSGYAEFSMIIVIACVLITLGAVVAAKDMLFRRQPKVEVAPAEAG